MEAWYLSLWQWQSLCENKEFHTHPTPAYNFMYATPKRLTEKRRWPGSAVRWSETLWSFFFKLSRFCHADIVFLISRLIFLLVAYSHTNRNISMHDQAKTVYHLIPLFLPELKHSSQQQYVDLGQANQASCTSQVLICTPANCKHNSAVLKPTTDNAFSL